MQKIFTKEFKPGEKWSGCIGKGKYIHFKALGDDANVSILLYNMRDTSERYNMPDSTKAQYTYHLTAGNVLMSDTDASLLPSYRTPPAGTTPFPVIPPE